MKIREASFAVKTLLEFQSKKIMLNYQIKIIVNIKLWPYSLTIKILLINRTENS